VKAQVSTLKKISNLIKANEVTALLRQLFSKMILVHSYALLPDSMQLLANRMYKSVIAAL